MEDDTQSPRKLPAIGIMAQLEPEEREKLAAAGRFVTAEPGEYIAVQGQHHHALAVIISGEVSVTAHAHGDSVELATLREGHTVGEMSVIDPREASANARVTSPTKLFIIKGENFEQLVEQDRATGMAIYRLLARELCQRLRHDSETMLRREDEMRSKFLDMDY